MLSQSKLAKVRRTKKALKNCNNPQVAFYLREQLRIYREQM